MKKIMGMKVVILILALSYVAAFSSPVYGEKLTVAVLGFETKDKAIIDLGTKITDLLTAQLSANQGLRLVEREKLDKVLEELGLGLTGIVDENQAARIGQLTGAKLLVTGRAFIMDRDLIIVAKVTATETSKVQAEIARGSLSGKLTPIVDKLSRKIARVISEKGPTMVARSGKKEDKIKEIYDKIKDKELPKVIVAILERHIGRPAIDPAAETEFTYLLKKCGFTVATRDNPGLSDWAREYLKESKSEIPLAIKADVIVLGEAFSEFGMRKGNLVSSKARVEIQVIDRLTGKVLAIDRQTNAAVDLSEQIAAKRAIQEATADIASRLILEFVENWNVEREKAKE